MSHFPVHVFTATPPHNCLEQVLERYSENREVEPYIDGFISAAKAQRIRDENYPDKSLVDALDEWGYPDVRWSEQPDGYVVLSTYNPDSKWDWWQVGGRWAGALMTFDGRGVDITQVKNLDFDNYIAERVAEANADYDRFETATKGLTIPPTFTELVDSGMDHEAARDLLQNDPWVIAARSVNPDSWLWPQYEYNVNDGGRDAYVAGNASPDVPFAWLDRDGEWHERGNMGWFAMVSGEKPFAQHAAEYRAYRDQLPGDTYITLIDCHI